MKHQDLEKLLGGYSAGTLTPQEEQLLFAAALEDQELFDALAREQPLRDLLQDPAARAGLLAALSDQPVPWYRRMAGWAEQPRVLASFAALFCVVAALTVWQIRPRQQMPVLTAQVTPAAPAAAPAPSFVTDAAPAQSAEPAPRRARIAAPEAKPMLRAEALESAQLFDNRPAGKDQQSDEPKAGASAGVIGGVPQTNGQLTPPAPAPQTAARQVVVTSDNQVVVTTANSQVATAAAPVLPVPPPPGREIKSLLALAPALKAAPAGPPLRWTVFRRRPGEEFVAGDADNLQAGDEVKLRVESNAAGYVYVVEKQAPLASSHLQPGQSFEAALAPQGPGRRDLDLWFSAQPMDWPRAGEPRQVSEARGGARQAASDSSNKTAVLTPAANSETKAPPAVRYPNTLTYQITLNYQ